MLVDITIENQLSILYKNYIGTLKKHMFHLLIPTTNDKLITVRLTFGCFLIQTSSVMLHKICNPVLLAIFLLHYVTLHAFNSILIPLPSLFHLIISLFLFLFFYFTYLWGNNCHAFVLYFCVLDLCKNSGA